MLHPTSNENATNTALWKSFWRGGNSNLIYVQKRLGKVDDASMRLLRPGSRLGLPGGIMVERVLTIALSVALLAVLAGAARMLATGGGGPDWGMIGNDSTNTRNQPLE